MSPIASTYKDRDTEETLDVYFYRPFGYSLALAARQAHLTPNAVTVLSIIIGVTAGCLLYYPSLTPTVTGIALLILADALDSADGQLARMTGVKSRYGRILDGLAGNLIFISVYLNICFGYIARGGSYGIFGLGIVAGISHTLQSALADYYRTAYLYFVRGAAVSEHDNTEEIYNLYSQTNWRGNPGRKIMLKLYHQYLSQQEFFSRGFLQLKGAVVRSFGEAMPGWLREAYRDLNRPMIKYYNILTINTRMIALFIFLLFRRPALYFVFESVALNSLLAYVIWKQNRISGQLTSLVESRGSS